MYRERSLLKRSVYPEDVAEAVAFFASERSAKSTGNIVNVDAGNAGRVHALTFRGTPCPSPIRATRTTSRRPTSRMPPPWPPTTRALGAQLERRGIAIDDITRAVANFRVAIPSWGVGTGGTRFGRFPGPGEAAQCVRESSRTAASFTS